MNEQLHDDSGARSPRRSWWIVLAMLAAIGLFFLLREHWGHIAGYWPYLLLLACPLMHLFHGHGRHQAHRPPPPGGSP